MMQEGYVRAASCVPSDQANKKQRERYALGNLFLLTGINGK